MRKQLSREARARMESILMRDKVKAPDGYLEALKSDLTNLLGDYFQFSVPPSLTLEIGEGGNYEVKLELLATKLKPFSTV